MDTSEKGTSGVFTTQQQTQIAQPILKTFTTTPTAPSGITTSPLPLPPREGKERLEGGSLEEGDELVEEGEEGWVEEEGVEEEEEGEGLGEGKGEENKEEVEQT